MKKTTAKQDAGRMISESRAALDEIVRQGARRMLQEALEHEVSEFLAMMGGKKGGEGRHEVVRNGFLPERELITGVGPLRIFLTNTASDSGGKRPRIPAESGHPFRPRMGKQRGSRRGQELSGCDSRL